MDRGVVGRRLLLIGVPAALVVLELNHPAGVGDAVYDRVKPMAAEWLTIHLAQLPLFGLMALAVLYLTRGERGFWPTLSQVGIWFFVVFYTALDSIAGLAVGTILTHQTPAMDVATVSAVVQLLFVHPIVGGVNSWLYYVGSYGWGIGLGAAIVSLYQRNRQVDRRLLLPPLALLAVCAYAIHVSHTVPAGPVGFGCFAAASLWFEHWRFGPAAEGQPAPPPG